MNIIDHYVRPRMSGVFRPSGRGPFRKHFGLVDFPTLIVFLILAIVARKGEGQEIIRHVEMMTDYEEVHIQFMLDQYEGRNPRHHLWHRDGTGKYRLLL